MRKIIAIAILLSIVNCTILFQNASYENDVEKSIKIKLDSEFRAKTTIQTLGTLNIFFDLFSSITYFTSPECEDCYYFADNQNEEKIKTFSCLPNNDCVFDGNFEGLQISKDYVVSGDIINLRMTLDNVHFYLKGVYYVKKIVCLNKNPSEYLYQKIGMVLGDTNPSFPQYHNSQVYSALYYQGKIDRIGYSLYYYDETYHFMIPGYDTSVVQSKRSFLNLPHYSWNQLFEYNKHYTFSGSIFFSDNQLYKEQILNIIMDPVADDSVFQLGEEYFQSFNTTINNYRLQPDLYVFTKEVPGKWSYPIIKFNFNIHINVDQRDNIPLPEYIDLSYPSTDFMVQKEYYYTLNVKFIEQRSQLKLGKRIFSKYVYYIFQNENGHFQVALAPLKQKKFL